MTTSVIPILAVLGVFLAYALLAPIVMNVGRFAGRTWLFCPERHEYARIGVNAVGAAFSTAYGAPDVSVRACSLLKSGEVCDERCLAGAQF
jgi:hypothetical protein